jgi:hypothetical protein
VKAASVLGAAFVVCACTPRETKPASVSTVDVRPREDPPQPPPPRRGTCTFTDTLSTGEVTRAEIGVVVDAEDRVLEIVRSVPGGWPGGGEWRFTITRTFDDRGRIIRYERRDSDPVFEKERVLTWSRDASGRLQRVEDVEEHVGGSAKGRRVMTVLAIAERDALGRAKRFDLKRSTLEDPKARAMRGKSNAPDVVEVASWLTRDYDALGRVASTRSLDPDGPKRGTRQRFSYPGPSTRVVETSFDDLPDAGLRTVTTYDDRRRPLRTETWNGREPAREPTLVSEKTYDSVGRLASSSSGREQSTFGYEGLCPAGVRAALDEPSLLAEEEPGPP